MSMELLNYIKEKIRMLENDFYITLTAEEKAHFHNLESDYAVDRYARDILLKKLWREDAN